MTDEYVWRDEKLGQASWRAGLGAYVITAGRRQDMPLSFDVFAKVARPTAPTLTTEAAPAHVRGVSLKERQVLALEQIAASLKDIEARFTANSMIR